MRQQDFNDLPNFTYTEVLNHFILNGFSLEQARIEVKRLSKDWFLKLQKVRTQINQPIKINCLTEGTHQPASYHYKALAGDWHIPGIFQPNKVLQACLDAGFTGIGWYPHWNSPGFHTDTRPGGVKLWTRNQDGQYLGLI